MEFAEVIRQMTDIMYKLEQERQTASLFQTHVLQKLATLEEQHLEIIARFEKVQGKMQKPRCPVLRVVDSDGDAN